MSDHADSYYAATASDRAGFDPLDGDLDVDVAIVGGGFTGVATAVEMAERGARVALCEAHKIGWGASGRNGGQITGSLSGDRAMEREFRRTLGDAAADYVWDLRWRGHAIIADRVAKYDIACDLKHGHMQTALTSAQMEDLRASHAAACARGMEGDVDLIPADRIRDYLETDLYVGGLLNRRNMHVHSLDLCVGEARAAESLGASIHDGTPVERIEHGPRPRLHTARGRITADHVLIAGNAYHLLDQPRLRGKLFPASLANCATEPLDEATARAINPHDLAVYDSRFVLDYYRLTADRRLMFGGGTNYSGRDSPDIEAELRPAIERTFPRLRGVRIDYAWAGHDGIVLNRIPQVGRSGNVLHVQGYSGHGIALSHILARALADALTGDPRDFDTFAAVRHWHLPLPRSVGSLAVAAGMAWYALRDRMAR
ncbi:NAD(P)/FAD-dependent oxidoreductase [Jannaschia aquimarina]|uniref:PuuB_3 protein n=1 Tax=Jannaschia aquimarina TaxID=935700 RepID=A0A0D1D5D2_9RHOB|nr:FAD-binding oxidoreductase [Jannaschia aquimarina]KIT15193.1 Gamma-glutamylputrescine oxidoreductase [Jannaschia aquimarina]SNS85508.1 Glycine/D-amino acid oxidase [Jannaschia aquimarina]